MSEPGTGAAAGGQAGGRAGGAAAQPAEGWDCHVHVFSAAAPIRAGHYVPADRPLGEIERAAQAHGIGRLVLVQPSVYGTDNTVMLQALEASAGRHRGVAVLDPAVGDDALDRLHRAGVRGVRFNLVSPAGHAGDLGAAHDELHRLAPRLRDRGWHVQWYVRAEALPQLADWQARTGLCFVLDHLGGLAAGLAEAHPAWAAARALAEGGAWIKLSGWYRLGAAAPYDALRPNLQRAIALFGDRTVWGSDWPHTSFAADAVPAYAAMLAPVAAVLDEAGRRALLGAQPAALYR